MELDDRVRLEIYERFVEAGRPPTVADVAGAVDVSEQEAEEAFRRLEAGRVIVLAPGTLRVWMAGPLSAVPTDFRVRTRRGDFCGNCAWDGLGVVAMLGGDGTVTTSCPDCAERISLVVRNGVLEPATGVVHFAVPAARWWQNIAYT